MQAERGKEVRSHEKRACSDRGLPIFGAMGQRCIALLRPVGACEVDRSRVEYAYLPSYRKGGGGDGWKRVNDGTS